MLSNGLTVRVWLVVVLLLLATSCAPSGATVKIEPPASAVQVNDTFKAQVKVENVANLTAIELHLSFDPAVLEVIAVNDGGFLQADFSVQNTYDNTAGTIDYAVAQINHAPVNGSGALLEIVFRAKAGGASPVRFRGTQAAPAGILLADPNGKAIPVTLTDTSISVGQR